MKDPVLAQALAALDGADVSASDGAGCTDLLTSIRKVRGWLAAEALGRLVSSEPTRRDARAVPSDDPTTKGRRVMRAPEPALLLPCRSTGVPAHQHASSAYHRRR